MDRNLEFKSFYGRNSVVCSIIFHLKKKVKGRDVKGKAKWEEIQTTHTSPGIKPTRGSGSVNPSTKRDQVMLFVFTLVNKFEGLDFDYFQNYPQLLWKLLLLCLQ